MEIYHKSNVGNNINKILYGKSNEMIYHEDILIERIPKDAKTINLEGGPVGKIWEYDTSLMIALNPEDTEDPNAVQRGYVVVYIIADYIIDRDGYVYEADPPQGILPKIKNGPIISGIIERKDKIKNRVMERITSNDNNNDFIEKEGIGFISPDYQEEGLIEPFFSSSPCESCDSSLGGNRYTIKARHLKTNDILKYDVCEDCYVSLVS